MVLFEISSISCGQVTSDNNESQYSLNFRCIVGNNRLNISISYSSEEYSQNTIQNILKNFKDNLCRIIEHCISKEYIELTPTDLGDDDLTLEELEFLNSFGGEE